MEANARDLRILRQRRYCQVDAAGVERRDVNDRSRFAFEAAALDACRTVHTPAVIALDEQLGALLIEAIERGTALVVCSPNPTMDSVAELLTSLHGSGVPDPRRSDDKAASVARVPCAVAGMIG